MLEEDIHNSGSSHARQERDSKDSPHEQTVLVFPDAEEHRLCRGRFLMGDAYRTVPRQALLEGFDPYAHAERIARQIVHQH